MQQDLESIGECPFSRFSSLPFCCPALPVACSVFWPLLSLSSSSCFSFCITLLSCFPVLRVMEIIVFYGCYLERGGLRRFISAGKSVPSGMDNFAL